MYRLYAIISALILSAVLVETHSSHAPIAKPYLIFIITTGVIIFFVLGFILIRKSIIKLTYRNYLTCIWAILFLVLGLLRFSSYSIHKKLSDWEGLTIIPAGYNKPSTNLSSTNVVFLVDLLSVDGKKNKNYRYQFKLKELYALNDFLAHPNYSTSLVTEKVKKNTVQSQKTKKSKKSSHLIFKNVIQAITSNTNRNYSADFLEEFAPITTIATHPILAGVKFYGYSRKEVFTLSNNTLLLLPYYITPTITITNQPNKTNNDGYQQYLLKNNYFANLYFDPDDTIALIVEPKLTAQTLYFFTLASIHNHLQNLLESYVASPISAFAFAMTTGIKDSISNELTEVFLSTGTYHILAVSGMNAGIIIFFFYTLFKFFRIRRVTNLLIIFLTVLPFYVYITDLQVTMVRAYLMGVLGLLLFMFDRRINLLTILALSFIWFILYDPTLLYSVSFQLSYAAIFGIAQFLKISDLLRIQSKIVLATVVSLGAQLGTLPVAIYYFGYNNFLSVFYNVTISLAVTIFFISVIGFLLVGSILSLPYLNSVLVIWGEIVGWVITLIGKTIIGFLEQTSFELSWYHVDELKGELFYAVLLMLIFSIISEVVYWYLKNRQRIKNTQNLYY